MPRIFGRYTYITKIGSMEYNRGEKTETRCEIKSVKWQHFTPKQLNALKLTFHTQCIQAVSHWRVHRKGHQKWLQTLEELLATNGKTNKKGGESFKYKIMLASGHHKFDLSRCDWFNIVCRQFGQLNAARDVHLFHQPCRFSVHSLLSHHILYVVLYPNMCLVYSHVMQKN